MIWAWSGTTPVPTVEVSARQLRPLGRLLIGPHHRGTGSRGRSFDPQEPDSRWLVARGLLFGALKAVPRAAVTIDRPLTLSPCSHRFEASDSSAHI